MKLPFLKLPFSFKKKFTKIKFRRNFGYFFNEILWVFSSMNSFFSLLEEIHFFLINFVHFHKIFGFLFLQILSNIPCILKIHVIRSVNEIILRVFLFADISFFTQLRKNSINSTLYWSDFIFLYLFNILSWRHSKLLFATDVFNVSTRTEFIYARLIVRIRWAALVRIFSNMAFSVRYVYAPIGIMRTIPTTHCLAACMPEYMRKHISTYARTCLYRLCMGT